METASKRSRERAVELRNQRLTGRFSVSSGCGLDDVKVKDVEVTFQHPIYEHTRPGTVCNGWCISAIDGP
jgi:hypothetical protein